MGVRRVPSEHEVAFFGVNQTQDHPQAHSSFGCVVLQNSPFLTVGLLPFFLIKTITLTFPDGRKEKFPIEPISQFAHLITLPDNKSSRKGDNQKL